MEAHLVNPQDYQSPLSYQKNSFDQSPQLQLPYDEPGIDGLAKAHSIG